MSNRTREMIMNNVTHIPVVRRGLIGLILGWIKRTSATGPSHDAWSGARGL